MAIETEKETAEAERQPEIELERLSEREAILTLETKLRIEAARAELEELEKDYPENKERIKELKGEVKSLREERLGGEASAERAKAQGFALEVKGFSEEIQKVAQKPEVKKTIKELEDAETKKDETEIENKRRELEKHTQEMPWLDNEEVKILLLRLLPSSFQKFFETHCQIEYDPNATSDTVSPPTREGGKITFTFGPKVLFEKLEHIKIEGKPVTVIKPGRLAFQISRMLGAFLTEPSNWNKVANQMEIERGKSPSWEDFVGLCLTSPQTARELSEPAYEHFTKCIQELSELSSEEIEERLKEKKTLDEVGDLAPGTKKEGVVSKIAKFPLRLAANTFGVFFRRVLAIYEEKQIWYDMTVSQLEIEEAKLITTRQEHVSDRDKRLWLYLLGGDKLGARGLILSDVTTSDSRWWRYHLYLNMFDPLYRRTGGEELSRESYFFLVRCTRTSQIEAHRWGSKIGEYIEVVEDGKKRYKRLSREKWDKGVFEEVRKLSARQVLSTADEAFDWMYSMGRPNELDEVFGGDAPLAFRQGWDDLSGKRWEEEKYKFETNHFEKINMPDWLLEGALGNKRTFKIDCDQILLIARLIASQRLSVEHKIGRDPFTSEHYRGIQRQLVIFYTKRLDQYKEWKEKNPGQKIQAYELFDEAIEKFMKIEMPAEEADQIIENEPNITLHRKAEETQKNFEKVGDSVRKRGEGFERRIRELPIPDWLKNYLAKNPDALLDLLVHPDITCQEVAREILGEVTRENLGQFRTLSEQIQSAIPVLGQYFRENQETIGPFLRAYDWVRANDLQPFLEAYKSIDHPSLENEPRSVQDALEIFKRKVDFDPVKGWTILEFTESEKANLDNLIESLTLKPITRLEKPFDKVSFIRDLDKPEQEQIRRYLSLKAQEAALRIETSRRTPPPKKEKAPPLPPPPEEEADMD